MSNDSPDNRPKIQPISKIRHWRQRFEGLDAEYVYRKPLRVRGADGKVRRVQVGERVDLARDGFVARRLKALWYSESIEVAEPGRKEQTQRNKGLVDNRARREREEASFNRSVKELKDKRDAEKYQRRTQRQEAKDRAAAEAAILVAEEREENELREMELQDIRDAIAKAAQAQLLERTENALKAAQERDVLKAEQDKLQAERDAHAADVEYDEAREKAIAGQEHEAATQEKLEARRALERLNQTDNSAKNDSPERPKNPNNKTVSADEAKAALDGE